MKGFQKLARIVKEGWSGNEPTHEPEVPDERKIKSITITYDTVITMEHILIGPSKDIIGATTFIDVFDTTINTKIDTTYEGE